jgi:methylmalonyl-CoA mutase N-terminal domain/subunit
VNPAVRKKQLDKLKALKEKRDIEKVKRELAALKKGAQGDSNLMPLIINCVREKATLGEICDELRDVFGEYRVSFVI